MKKSNFFDIDINSIIRWILLILTFAGFIFAIFTTFSDLTNAKIVNIVMIMPFVFFMIPYLVMTLYEVKKVEAKMEIVPRFLRDVVDNVESGLDLIASIKSTQNNEYLVLNQEITKLVNQLSWGISFDKAFLRFAENVGSKNLKRDFLLIVEARRVGGHVEKLLRELSEKINSENLRIKERKSNLASNTFTGYISFIIFIFIIILTYNNLFLNLTENVQSDGSFIADNNNDALSKIYLTLLTLMSYELAILSGFLFGLMQENNLISGAPHVVALVTITFIGFFFFVGV